MAKFTSKTKTDETAVFASSNGEGVHAESTSATGAAIAGIQVNTNKGTAGAGVYGESRGEGAGIVGRNLVKSDPSPGMPAGPGGPGAFFQSEQKEAIFAETKSIDRAAIAGIQNNPLSTGAALYAEHITGGTAGFFKGNIIVTGDISFPGADCAEDFTIQAEATAEPGCVMSLDTSGELVPCASPYEKKVVGIIAGAGTHHPGIIMDRQLFDRGNEAGVGVPSPRPLRRQPIALVGKAFCKVDASYAPIAVGDLLTSSATHGHAMKAADPALAFGAVIGKAMAPLEEGRGLIPVLIALQ